MEKIMYSVTEVASNLQKFLLLDVREAELFGQLHIPGAVNIPDFFSFLAISTPEGLTDLHQYFAKLLGQAGVGQQSQIIVYGDSMASRYGAACRAYWLLKYLGHDKVGILDGGLTMWNKAGLPLETKVVKRDATSYQIQPRPEMMVSKEEMVAALDDPAITILDNRDAEEWYGRSSSPYGIDFAPRKGRIPGARWIEWQRFIHAANPAPEFVQRQTIISLGQEQGIDQQSNIIIYCFKGCRAAHTYVALRQAGFQHIRIYFGSWNEWSRDLSLPISPVSPSSA